MGTITFIPVLAAYCETLPRCPDGSGDLWWDEASYIRYQTFDPIYEPEQIQRQTDSPNYCAGQRDPWVEAYWVDAPF